MNKKISGASIRNAKTIRLLLKKISQKRNNSLEGLLSIGLEQSSKGNMIAHEQVMFYFRMKYQKY